MEIIANDIFIAVPDFYIIPSVIANDIDLQVLDGYVYAVVYWYTKLRLEKCTAKNETISAIISKNKKKKINRRSIANSLTRLSNKGFVKIILNSSRQRVEIIPLISFSASPISDVSSVDDTMSSVDDTLCHAEMTPVSSFDDTIQKSNNKKELSTNVLAGLPKKQKKQPACPLLNNSPLKTKYANGHTECVEFIQSVEKDRGNKFINKPKQFLFVHKILQAGFGFEEMNKVVSKIEKKYGINSWDFATVANWLEKGGLNDSVQSRQQWR